MSMEVVKPGLLTTVQDLGRKGYAKYGIPKTGAMDGYAHRLANWLVGNNACEAALEITWSGFSVRFNRDMLVAITGANMAPECGRIAVPMWRPVWFRAGSELSFKRPVSGCRAYLAAAGGLDVPQVMGSRSTYLRAKVGGLHGRALQAGDMIPVKFTRHADKPLFVGAANSASEVFCAPAWSAAPRDGYGGTDMVVRVTRGREYGDFREEAIQRLIAESYRVQPDSDRMGYRLSGLPLLLETQREYISEGVADGTVQVPADGQPFILMADRQTLGGYPKIAQVISVDLPLVAQLPPGGSIRFREVSIAEAERLYCEAAWELRLLRRMINYKLKEA
ncbi:biotin-dependent carboxyltransferase family protein [Paenibacillus donghaensis]|uniref:5-oxoprolinase subunit C family protein n=1 Tax=Paenibacillus donghaensis TaxID=414771 RepID=UPI0018836D5E|nr:biotin-dependent carboxyltransferase family protein [Paenibacillus donghaensis]MBE9917579.1 biotin-dependent carboxyltransferase family protein [Paenibacillus donghaensis]